MAKQTFTTGQVLTAAQVNSLQSNDFNQTVSVKTAAYTLVAADKGTRVEFNTSGSVTCTVNSGLFDAGDTLVIQNRGSGTVTVTAGTATVNTSASLAVSQYGQGILYFIDNASSIFFAGAPGDITGVTTGTDSGLAGGVTSGTADLKLRLQFDAQTGTTYTLASNDLNQLVTCNNSSAITVTVPPSVFTAGDQIHVQQIGTGQVSFAQGSGVTITSTGATASAPKLRARYSAATVICTASNTFTIVGDLS